MSDRRARTGVTGKQEIYVDAGSGVMEPVSSTNPLPTTATISGDVNVDNNSVSTTGLIGKAGGTNADFTTSIAGAGAVINADGFPAYITTFTAEDIVSIVQIATDGSVTETITRDDATITVVSDGGTGWDITVTGKSYLASDTFLIYTNIERIYDSINITQLGGNTISTDTGVIDAGTQRVTLATDDTVSTDLTAIKTAQTSKLQMTRITDGTEEASVNTSNQLETEAHQATHDDFNANANVQQNDTDVSTSNPLQVQLGDGAEQVNVNVSNELQVRDDDANTTLTSIEGKDFATETTQATLAVESGGNLDTIAGDTTSIDGKTPALGTAAMAASTPVTLATDDTQLGAVGSAADVDGNVHGQLRYIGEAVDGLEASNVLPHATHTSPNDFTATYTSNVTITLSGYPTITDSSQIVYILYIPTGGSGSSVLINGVNGVTITESSGVLTVDGAGTPFASGDVYRIGLLLQDKATDVSNDLRKVQEQSAQRGWYTDAVDLVSAQDLTAAYADFGSEISMNGDNKLGIWITADVNDSEDVDLKVLGKWESGGTDEYEIDGIAVETLWTTGASDFKKYYEFDVGTIPYIQLQAIAGTVGATAGDLTIKYNTKY